MPEPFPQLWSVLGTAITLVVAAGASAHAILNKRDSRAAVGWVGLIWLVPLVGALLYILFGINRVRRRAIGRRPFHREARPGEATARSRRPTGKVERAHRGGLSPAGAPRRESGLRESLRRLLDGIARRPLTDGNDVRMLVNGDEAYPEMIAAIDAAERTVALATYIFDNDAAGRLFLDALAGAVGRGVTVRVLLDAVGARYSWPPIVRELGRRGVPVARFGRTLLPWRLPYLNLRNHRKLLVVDGRVGFTGGLNIREGCILSSDPRHPVQDLQCRLEGPVVAHLGETFAEDWAFTTGEDLDPHVWTAAPGAVGTVAARGLADGPDEDFEVARHTLLGALACANSSVRVMTPYFLPDSGLITALGIAAMRGVEVEILLPEANNLALVQWAATAQLWQVLATGCEVFYTPPPFDHTKLLVVDGEWVLFGSSNWDARSLRLNFEFDVECYDVALAERGGELMDRKRAGARPVTLEEVDGRPLLIRLRDGVARLAAPYL
ncbi:MAG: phospholipase D-like domain-containing protein [Gemmatimonadota bacterium]